MAREPERPQEQTEPVPEPIEVKPGVPVMPDPGRPETFGGGGNQKVTTVEFADE